MSSNNNFESFAARLREFMRASAQAPAGEGDFDRLALDLFALHFQHNAPYRRFCEARRVTPRALEHWSRIPAMPASAFKDLDLSCLSGAERKVVFHSSGTTGQRPSRHFHSPESLRLYEASLWPWFERHLLPEPSGWSLVVLTPGLAEAPHSSLVYMFDTIRRRLGPAEAVFAGTPAANGAWEVKLEAAAGALTRAARQGRPVLLLGTAFSFVHLLDHLSPADRRLELPPGSRVMETGGYKGRTRVLPQAGLHALITARLGIPPTHIVSEYGMSELSSQAYDRTVDQSKVQSPKLSDESDQSDQFDQSDMAESTSRSTEHAPRATRHTPRLFRFPPWVRLRIISPETGREVAAGETGLIRVLDLANVYSVLAIQTEDLGTRRGDGFELLGRAALAEPRGCSLMSV